MDTIKIRSQTMPDKRITQIVRNTFKLEGFRGFYKGLIAPMLTTGVTNAIFFGVHFNTLQSIRNHFDSHPDQQCEGILSYPMWHWDEFFSGAFAGAMNTIVSAPVEAVKTRMQANAGKYSLHVHKMSSMLHYCYIIHTKSLHVLLLISASEQFPGSPFIRISKGSVL